MSATRSPETLAQLRAAYVDAIDNALARRDFVAAEQLGSSWDRRVARLAAPGARARRVSLRRLTGKDAPSGRAA